jgi:hypothetical protein
VAAAAADSAAGTLDLHLRAMRAMTWSKRVKLNAVVQTAVAVAVAAVVVDIAAMAAVAAVLVTLKTMVGL